MADKQHDPRKKGTRQPDVTGLVPPHDIDVEQALLGACIAKHERLDDVAPLISAADFYSQPHRIIYAAMLSLLDRVGHLDLVSLAAALHDSGQITGCGGSTYLAQLVGGLSTSVSVAHWAEIVRDLSRRRMAMDVALQVFEGAQDRAADVQNVAVQVSNLVDRVLADKLDTGRQTPIQIVRDYEAWLDLAMDEDCGYPVPWEGLQQMTGGLLPGEVCVLGARPSNGKTALALNAACYGLARQKRVGIVSLEMRSRSLMSRLCAMSLQIDAQKFRNRTLDSVDRERIGKFLRRFSTLPLRMWDEPEFSPARLRVMVKQWKRQLGGLDLLIIDYLQLMDSDAIDGRMACNREQEVARISKAVKRTALGEDVPVLLLAQLSRQAEKDTKPMLSHLRESGSLEQDADFVFFLSFWDPRLPGDDIAVDLDVAKGRGSRTGSVPLIFKRRYLQFQQSQIIGGSLV